MPDPDARLSPGSLVENLAALWSADPAIARWVEAVAEADRLTTEPAKNGGRTVAVVVEGRPTYLHSRYDPAAEAHRQAADVPVDTLQVFVFGLGLGHLAAALLTRCPEATVWAFEPDPAMVLAALESHDLAAALTDRRLRLLGLLDKAALLRTWSDHLAAISASHRTLTHAPSARRDPDYHAAAAALLAEFVAYAKTTLGTLLLNGRKTCENLARNVAWYAAAPGIGRLKDAARGRPAIVVSAGPSLRKNKHLLKAASERAVIVSVQTTFKQLLDLGVQPDFVTSLDYHDICTQFFRDLPPGVQTELVAEPKATPKIFDLHPGPLSLLGNDFIDGLLAGAKPDRPRLPAGATVAHLAFYLTEHLGCDPVIFVGQDLGFSDGLAYAPGTSYDDLWRPELGRFNTVETMQWQRIVRDRNILRRVPDYRGRPTYTEERLFTYLQQFERDFAKSGRRIIDATEGGVAKLGATPMTLADALAEYCPEPITKGLPPHAGLDWSHLADTRACLLRRSEEAGRIRQTGERTLPLLRQTLAALDRPAEVTALVARIDVERGELIELNGTYDLITQLSQRNELDRFLADRRIAAAGVSGKEKQRRQIERDLDNVAHVVRSAEEFQSLMTACVAQIDAIAARHPEAA